MAHMQVRYHEDPSIAQCAYLEFERVWGIIEAGVQRGAPFYVAREKVLAFEIPRISKTYGPVVAERVSKHVQWRSPSDLSKAAKDALYGPAMANIIEACRQRHGGYLPWYQRLSIAVIGLPLF